MLSNVISGCTNEYLQTNKRFYYLAYHTVLFLDYYLTIPPHDFSAILPFSILGKEKRPLESIGDMISDKMYSREQLLNYVEHSRAKCKKLVESLNDDNAKDLRFTEGQEEGDMDYSVLEILLYNMRHTQHHVGQLNLMIRNDFNKHMEWVFR